MYNGLKGKTTSAKGKLSDLGAGRRGTWSRGVLLSKKRAMVFRSGSGHSGLDWGVTTRLPSREMVTANFCYVPSFYFILTKSHQTTTYHICQPPLGTSLYHTYSLPPRDFPLESLDSPFMYNYITLQWFILPNLTNWAPGTTQVCVCWRTGVRYVFCLLWTRSAQRAYNNPIK